MNNPAAGAVSKSVTASEIEPPAGKSALPRESRRRSLAKALSWRVVATLTTAIIAYFITGQVEVAVLIGGIEFVVKFVIYYLHERAWVLLG